VKTQSPEDPTQARRPKTSPGSDLRKVVPLVCSLAAGCTGVPVKPDPFTCPEGSQRAMRELHWRDGTRLSLVIDDRHGAQEFLWLRPGDTVVGAVPEYARDQKAAPPGTRFLEGKVYVVPEKTADGYPGRIIVKYERVRLPNQGELPVCFIVNTTADELKDGAGRTANHDSGVAVDRWP
jgi:serine/threonine-protein kinase